MSQLRRLCDYIARKPITATFVLLGIALNIAAPAAIGASAGFPAKTVRLIVPSGAGGGTDILARIMAQKAGDIWGQQVVVDNRPGAASIIGVELAARAAPDGYTLVMVSSGFVINPSLVRKLPYDTDRDFAAIVQVASLPNVLVIHPSMPVRSLKELVAFARSRPGQLTYASAGNGSSPHLSMELMRNLARLDLIHVPYKGSGPATIDVIGGQVTMMFPSLPTVMGHIKSGKLRAVGVTTAKRSGALPDVPAIAEVLPGYEAVQWFGLLAPAQTPQAIIMDLNRAMNQALSTADVRNALLEQGAEPVGGSPQAFGDYLKVERRRWAEVVEKSGIRPE